jgi:hypothetical protein
LVRAENASGLQLELCPCKVPAAWAWDMACSTLHSVPCVCAREQQEWDERLHGWRILHFDCDWVHVGRTRALKNGSPFSSLCISTTTHNQAAIPSVAWMSGTKVAEALVIPCKAAAVHFLSKTNERSIISPHTVKRQNRPYHVKVVKVDSKLSLALLQLNDFCKPCMHASLHVSKHCLWHVVDCMNNPCLEGIKG